MRFVLTSAQHRHDSVVRAEGKPKAWCGQRSLSVVFG